SEVREVRERVRTALKNAGFLIPVKRVTVNLSPANVRKQGTGFDLPVAVGILVAMGELSADAIKDTMIVGELLLSGRVGGICGALPLMLAAKKAGLRRCIIPKENEAEGAVVDGLEVICVESLIQLVAHLQGTSKIRPKQFAGEKLLSGIQNAGYDFSEVSGQHFVKRGLEIAAAGLHNMIMIGSPGAGKTMLAKCIPSILPPLSMEECLEVSAVYSVAGKLQGMRALITERPFVSPHHSVTATALSGGGIYPRPGSISLAHHGVLFLDELPEFSRSALEVLRQPLEERVVHVTRSKGSYTYPADFMLIGAMNPCPCGAYPDLGKCTCTETARKRYLSRLSKPLLDRMDICTQVRQAKYRELVQKKDEECSAAVRGRVIQAQQRQYERFFEESRCVRFNSGMGIKEIDRYCKLTAQGEKLLEDAFKKFDLSTRAYHRILRVARTIADLDNSGQIREYHLAEAVHYKFNFEIQ
ncbi:MAG TPA: YifB family Mg chelatase-like AAA ATPase, partial [Lachnospiraceae bacterium]|nr:YifB family Mg chelatase-like AAA ATPase [Lachnospiraceae bacterium]